uniref:Uncharacterized protein n=1 Tax=Salix viminalis TaxID=40686 RepID=A0A6N2NCP0_SALVM
MSYKRQRLQESHIFTNQEDCSFNTPQLDDEYPSSSYGVLTQSSTLERNHNPFPTDSQCYPLFHSEASSSNTPLPTQNQHNHHPSASTSLSLVQDHVPPESAPSTNDLGFFINGHEATGQASYQRKRGRISYAYIDFGDKTFKCCHCMALFWVNERLTKSSQLHPRFSLCCLGGKIKLPRPPPTPHPLDDLLNNLLGRNPRCSANVFVPTTLCSLLHPWELILINQLTVSLAHMFSR